MCDHPHTTKALGALAEWYDWDVLLHDEDAERRDWNS